MKLYELMQMLWNYSVNHMVTSDLETTVHLVSLRNWDYIKSRITEGKGNVMLKDTRTEVLDITVANSTNFDTVKVNALVNDIETCGGGRLIIAALPDDFIVEMTMALDLNYSGVDFTKIVYCEGK